MVWLRKLLYPFSILYGAVTGIRNMLYDNGTFKSSEFDIPVIAVGNLSVGGTGKTPMIEYLIRLLAEKHRVATLSRGYKRRSSGFVLAGTDSTAEILGDEPMQFHRKFPEVAVAVDADRTNGIQNLMDRATPDVILLDDAYQHRKVKAGFYILLTAFGDEYCNDHLLPAGNLREGRSGAARADAIVVTKCPPDLSAGDRSKILEELRANSKQHVFFTSIGYSPDAISGSGKVSVSQIRSRPKLLLAGIAKPEPFFTHLRAEGDSLLKFPDHHFFSESDFKAIMSKAAGRAIVTTEKDYVRLYEKLKDEEVYYVPIETRFLENGNEFDNLILNYVGRSTANR